MFWFTSLCLCKECSNSYSWQLNCSTPNLSDIDWVMNNCSSDNSWLQTCEVFDTIVCDGNRSFVRKQWCAYKNGANYGFSLVLAYLTGLLGFDRFYLGYPSIGLMKLFTGGFFFLGYLIDCVLITLQILGPADGSGYAAQNPFPFLRMKNHNDVI